MQYGFGFRGGIHLVSTEQILKFKLWGLSTNTWNIEQVCREVKYEAAGVILKSLNQTDLLHDAMGSLLQMEISVLYF